MVKINQDDFAAIGQLLDKLGMSTTLIAVSCVIDAKANNTLAKTEEARNMVLCVAKELRNRGL